MPYLQGSRKRPEPERGSVEASTLMLGVEASGFLVGPPVFNTEEAEHLGLAGSIPVRLRHAEADTVIVEVTADG